jgi:DNA-binding MarR family transcriptional regulator
VSQRIERDLQAEGLPPLGWYDVLWALCRAPGGRLRINKLADQVVLSRTGMVRLVDRIEAAGLLRREPVPEDRRGAYAVITEEGVEMLRKMWPVYARSIEALFLAPVGADAAVVRDALERVAERDGSNEGLGPGVEVTIGRRRGRAPPESEPCAGSAQ